MCREVGLGGDLICENGSWQGKPSNVNRSVAEGAQRKSRRR